MSQVPDLTRRKRVVEIQNKLNLSTTPEAAEVKEMLAALLAEAKDKLVESSGEDMLKVQGEARLLKRLYNALTRTNPLQET